MCRDADGKRPKRKLTKLSEEMRLRKERMAWQVMLILRLRPLSIFDGLYLSQKGTFILRLSDLRGGGGRDHIW